MGLPRNLTSYRIISPEGECSTNAVNRVSLGQKYTIFSPFRSIKAFFGPFFFTSYNAKAPLLAFLGEIPLSVSTSSAERPQDPTIFATLLHCFIHFSVSGEGYLIKTAHLPPLPVNTMSLGGDSEADTTNTQNLEDTQVHLEQK